jgi:phosphopantetheinyl transferase (holo-ACP synthase)
VHVVDRSERVTAARALELPAGAPAVRLLDARSDGLDEPSLRGAARAIADMVDAVADAEHAPCVSRSYRYPHALVAWHDAPVGVDIERIERFDPEFLESISTPSERARSPAPRDLAALARSPAARDPAGHADSANPRDPASYTASLWASKEALAKALGDPVAYDPRRLESPMFWPAGRSGPWRAAPLPVPDGHNAWLCWRVLTA